MPDDDELVLITRVARDYYLEGRTRVEIASRLGTSRFRVARLLEQARDLGVVTITIRPHGLVDRELSARLRDRFGLVNALAVWAESHDREELYGQLGKAAAGYLVRTVTPDDVLGFDTGRSVGRIADHLGTLPACDVVQLSGLGGTVQLNGMEILRRVVDVSGGTAYPLYAPQIAHDAAAADVYRQQREVIEAMEQYRRLTLAIISVGSWVPSASQVYDGLSPADREQLRAAGVVAETCGFLFADDGTPIDGLTERRLGIPLDDLSRVPNVVAVAGGAEKATAIHALLRSGILNTLITDVTTARSLLQEAGDSA